jgi:hypothetical protein
MRRTHWIALNLFGMALYLVAIKPIIGSPDEAGPGDGIYFAFSVLPILLSCLHVFHASAFVPQPNGAFQRTPTNSHRFGQAKPGASELKR